MRAVVVCLLLAGCSAAPSSPEVPTEPLVPGIGSQPASWELFDCMGISTMFYFDGAAARAAVPDPFVPTMLFGERDGAYGELEHRTCQVRINGTSLGSAALALGGAWVMAPAHLSNGSMAVYLMRVATDHPELASLLAWHGLPVQVRQMDDNSLWLGPGRGVHDTSVQGDRLIGVVADSDFVFSTGGNREWFHAQGNITRLSGQRTSAAGDASEVALTLDPAVWGAQAAANIFFSTYAAGETWKTAFDHFEP